MQDTIAFEDDKSSVENKNMMLSSDRVIQLKREIEDLDNRLMNTNTINFEEIRNSIKNYQYDNDFSSDDESSSLRQSNQGQFNKENTYEIEEEILRQSQGRISTTSKQAQMGMIIGSSCPQERKRQTIENKSLKNNDLRYSVSNNQSHQAQNTGNWTSDYNLVNTSQFSQDGEVSFDLEKIIQKRNLNIKTAFESNLKEKQEFISGIQQKVNQIKKECEAKVLKLTHLKYERENIINQIQVDSMKKQEQEKESREQLRRIEIKKKEDETAFNLAQNQIRKQILEQETLLNEIMEQINFYSKQLKDYRQSMDSRSLQNGLISVSNELQERINQQSQKVNSLMNKKQEVEYNLQILKDFLRSISEEIQMTQEDLNGKLMQRAEFVAQREELDQMLDSGKNAFGKSFEIYLKIKEITNNNGSNSARFLYDEYETQKALSFFQNIIMQIKQSATTRIDLEKALTQICNLGTQLGINLEKKLLIQKLELSNQEKDLLYDQREKQLKEISLEIKRFEKLIKENSNLVDNMILPQLKAMSATYNEHKSKYKKLKQAGFVLKERVKKAEKELAVLDDEKTKFQAQQSAGSKIKQAESELKVLNERLMNEQEEMDRLNENAAQLEKEFRRAKQALTLKEREVLHKMGVDGESTSPNFNATNLSSSLILKQEQDEERLRKRFTEVEDKIRVTLQERDEANRKLNDYQRLLKEAQESLEHAQQKNKQSDHSNSNQQNFNTLPNNRRHYNMAGNGKIQRQKTDDFSQEYQMTSVTDSELDKFSKLGSSSQSSIQYLNQQQERQQPVRQSNHGSMQLQTSANRVQHYKANSIVEVRNEKENGQSQGGVNKKTRINKNFMTKIDLSKVLQNQDSNQVHQQYSQPQIISSSSQHKQMEQMENKYKSQEIYQNISQSVIQETSTDISHQQQQLPQKSQNSQHNKINKQLVVNQELLNKVCSQNATAGNTTQINEDILNLLQQTKLLDESQGNNTSQGALSLLNLSDLLMNNSALQNLLQLAATQDSRDLNSKKNQSDHLANQKLVSQLTFNNTYNQPIFDQQNPYQNIGKQVQIRYNTQQNDQYGDNDSSQLNQSQLNKSQNYALANTSEIIDDNCQNQTNLIDSSLLNYLNEINQQNNISTSGTQHHNLAVSSQSSTTTNQNFVNEQQRRREIAALKRSSIETAEFFNNQQQENNYNHNISPYDAPNFNNNKFNYKQTHTIEVDLTNRQQLEHNKSYQGPVSPEINRKRSYMDNQSNPLQFNDDHNNQIQNQRQLSLAQSIQFNPNNHQKQLSGYNQQQPQTHQKNMSNCYQNQISGQKSQNNNYNSNHNNSNSAANGGWMSKYLSNVNDHSRMDCLSESISPKPNARRASKINMLSQNWNRSNSQENRYGPSNQNKMNMSINSSHNNFMSLHNQSCSDAFYNSRSGSRLNKKSKKLNKSINGVDSSLMLQQSIHSSMLNPISMSINFNNISSLKNSHHQQSCYSSIPQDIMNFSRIDVSFAERIVPLLDGAAFYKKFSQRQSLNENAFDPLNSDKFPPECCGYGIRLYQLDKSLMYINVRQSLKNAVECTIPLNDIVKPILPQTTMDIIRAQKQQLIHQQTNQLRRSSRNGQLVSQSCVSSTKDLLEEFLILDTKGSISHLAKIGIVNKNSELYRQKCLDSTFYPFSIALTKGRVELIATSYETLKNWIIGINLLVSNKKHIPKIKQLMEIKLDC